MGKGTTLFKFIAAVILVIIAFNYNVFLGIAAVALSVSYAVYSSIALIYAFMGNAEYNKNNLKGAIEWFRKAYDSGKANVNIKASYAYLILRDGRIDEAEEIFNKLKKSKLSINDEMMIKSNLALVYWKRGDIDMAIETLTEVYEKYKNSTVYGSLGYLLIQKGDLDKALQFNLEAYDYNDSDKVILDNLGQNYYFKGDYDKAEEVYEKLIKMPADFPEPYYFYGRVLEAKGNKKDALDSMRKALEYKFSFLSSITKEEVEEKIKQLEAEIGDAQ